MNGTKKLKITILYHSVIIFPGYLLKTATGKAKTTSFSSLSEKSYQADCKSSMNILFCKDFYDKYLKEHKSFG